MFAKHEGKEYTGEFQENQIKGRGKMKWRDGTVYEGSFNNAKFEGYGEMTYPDGSYYHGFWEDGLRHGKNGVLFDAQSQKTTKGIFVKDEF